MTRHPAKSKSSNRLSEDRNDSPDTVSSTPNMQSGVEDILSSPHPSRKQSPKPTINSAAIAPEDRNAPASSGTLYMVAVPIGCMEDISLRALRVLRESALILCENAAVSRSVAEHFGIATSLFRYGGRDAGRKNRVWLDRLLAGEDLAFVCDAGTPGIADPGPSLVRAALQHSIPVIAVPGPAAVLVALVASGLSTERFAFDGFPPRLPADRDAFFQRLAHEERTLLLYESAGLLVSTLKALCQIGRGARRVAVASRLTQPTEEWFRGTLEEAVAHFRKRRPHGEVTLVVEGKMKSSREDAVKATPRQFNETGKKI